MTSSLFKTKAKKAGAPPAAPAPEAASTPQLKMVSTRLTRRQWRQIKDFALDEETTVQALFVSALAEKMARKGITLEES
jgi:hypothetical protein